MDKRKVKVKWWRGKTTRTESVIVDSKGLTTIRRGERRR